MKQIKTLVLGIAATAGVLVPLADANAWVAAGRGYGGRGFVAAGGYHGGAYYHPAYHPTGCYGCGAAAGAVAGMAVGAGDLITVADRHTGGLLAPVLECVETQVYLLGRPFVSVYADYAAFLVPVVVSLIVHVHARLQIRRHG